LDTAAVLQSSGILESCKLEAVISAFLKSLENQLAYSESTRVAYRNDLRIFQKHLEQMLSRMPTLDDFSRESVIQFLESENRSGRSFNTLLRRRATLQRFEKFLLDTGECNESRLGDLFLQDLQTQLVSNKNKEHPVSLSEDELSRLFSIIGDNPKPLAIRDRAIFSLLLETGLSTSSLTAIDLADLDLKAGSIHIQIGAQLDCWVPMGQASELVGQYLKYGRPELNPPPEEPALFISQNGVRMSRQSVWQIFRQWGRSAGIKEALSPRILRHTAVLRMVGDGRPFQEIQALLGHTNSLSTHALLHRLAVSHMTGKANVTGEELKAEI
jgi:integrase/recombinase XerD